jgi:hypothetical protein
MAVYAFDEHVSRRWGFKEEKLDWEFLEDAEEPRMVYGGASRYREKPQKAKRGTPCQCVGERSVSRFERGVDQREGAKGSLRSGEGIVDERPIVWVDSRQVKSDEI